MPNIYDQFDEKATANPYDQFDLPPKPEESAWGGLKRGATEAFQQLPQLGAGLVAGAGALAESALGEGGIATGIKKAGIKGYDDWGKKIADKAQESDSWNYSYDKAKEGDFGALVNWVVHGLGYVGGQAIQTLATGGIGAVGGKFVASTAAKQIAEGMVAKEAASIAASEAGKTLAADAVAKLATANVAAKFATIGQTAAVGASAFSMEGGEIFGGLTSENNDRALTGSELGKAFAATLGAGALEFVGDKVGLDIMLGKSKLLKPAASLTGFGGAAARAGVAAAGAAPIEAGTEFAQTLAEEYGKGKDPFSEASLAQARDGAALGALGGAAMGSVGGIIHGAKAPAEPAPAATPETLRLGNTPDPMLSFRDGTVGRRSEVEAYINSLPEADRVAARAKLSGLAPQPADIMADNVTSVDHAIALAQSALASTPTARMGAMITASAGPGFDARSVAPGYFDQQELDGLVASEQRNLQVMQAQIEQDRAKQAEMNQIPGIAAEQDVVASALQRAAATEAPNAMSAAFNRLADKTIGPDPVAEAPAVPVPKPEAQPRIVPRFDGAVTMPLELAQLQVEMDGGEVVRVANRNGKYGYSVLKEKQAVSPVLPAQSAIETVAKEPAGREGYEKPFEVDAKALMAAFEKENGSALVWNNDKLNAVRGGAKSTGNIEAAINARGDIGINDGRHRIAVAAERGEKVTVFASEEDGLAILGKIKKSKPTDPRLIAKSTQSIDPEHLGRNSKPLAEGGKPFKTKDEAATAKNLQPMLRVIKTKGGFALAPKTEKQLAAEQQAAKRLGIARTGQAGVPTAAHEFIAGEGGMDASTKNEFGFGNNPRVGNRTLFAGARGGMSLDAATEKLIEAGYLPEGATHSDTVALVNRSFTVPQHTAEGTEVLAEAAMNQHFDDYLTAQEESAQDDAFDPFESASDMGLTLDDADWAGYDALEDPIKLEVQAFLAQAEALGIDTDTIKENAHEGTRNGSEQDYYEATRDALTSAIEASNRSGNQDAGAQGNAGSQEGVAKPLYASRAVTNAADIIAWAQSQGFKTTLPANDMHVTVAYSSKPVDGAKAGKTSPTVSIESGTRTVEPLGDGGAVVLKFASDELQSRWKQYRDAGASWDYEGYTPHVTLTYDASGVDLSKVTPYTGPINLGEETQEALNEDKEDEYVEAPTLTAPTRADIEAQQDRADSAAKSETARRKSQELADKQDRERKDIAARSEAAADTFVLGGDAEQNLSGQGSIFDEPAPVSKTEATAKPAVKPITELTFDQWAKQEYDASDYKAAYLEAFEGNEKRASLGSVIGTTDNDTKTPELLKLAKQEYIGKLLDQPREAVLSLDVWDSLPPAQKIEAQRNFYDLDARITKRLQENASAQYAEQKKAQQPYQDALDEVQAEIKRLDGISGPDTAKVNTLRARRDRLTNAIFDIGQGKAPDGRLLKPQATEAATFSIDPLEWNASKLSDAYSMVQLNTLYEEVKSQFSNETVGGSPVDGAGMATKDRLNEAGLKMEAALKKAIGIVYEKSKQAQPADQATAILDAANVTGKERIDALKDVKKGDITTDELQAAYPAKDGEPKPAKIEDSGEVLEGARKLYAKNYAAKLAEGEGMDTTAVPLSKSWPEPDYQRLLDEGADPWAVAMAHAVRDATPAKPSSWKLKGWANGVEMLRGMASQAMSGELTRERISTKGETHGLHEWLHKIDLYEAVGHAKSLKTLKFSRGEYGMYDGQTFSPPKVMWSINMPGTDSSATWSRGNWGHDLVVADTKAEAIEKFKSWSEAQGEEAPAAAKATSFDIYSYRSKPGITIVGKRINSTKSIDLKEFSSVKEAREYKAANQTELETLLAKAKFEPSERGESNAPRVGADHRNGADVTSEQFREAFGFRGEQFGASMPQNERQANMNQAFDALMDLAGVVGIPPKALSLNGELGLAFGARGTGGKGAFAAHYERDTTGAVTPNRVVINLTRKNGAGSLAHEWFHAVDNYFARMRGEKAGMLTDSYGNRGEGVRPEMVDAFKQLMQTVNMTGIKERSKQLDKKRVKDYWSTGLEMAARSFESYVIAKLQDNNGSNDYLANIVPESLYLMQGSYPYPVMGEMPAIRSAFDNFFDVVQTKETEQGVAMFSRTKQADIASAWQALASNEQAFTYPASTEKTMDGILADIGEQLKVVDEPGGVGKDVAKAWRAYPLDANGQPEMSKPAYIIHYKDGKIELNVEKFNEGDFGSYLYALVGAYAHNNNLKFEGDRFGISEAGMERRLENMISLALKYGTTDFIAPHPDQLKQFNMEWKDGDSAFNLEQMLMASYNSISKKFPAIKDYVYDFDRSAITDKQSGMALDDGQRKRLSAEARDAGVRAGERTIARAVFTNTIASEATGEARRELLERINTWSRGTLDPTYVESLYSRTGTSGQSVTETKAQVVRVTAKQINGPRTVVVESPEDLPVEAPSDARGLYYKGVVYVVASNNANFNEVASTLAHETIAHYGLRTMLGSVGWKQLMANISLAVKSGNKPMKALSDQIKRTYVDENGKLNLNDNQHADELAAATVEAALDENGEFKPGFGFLKSVFAKIAQFLRDQGINVKFTNTELQGMLVLAMRNLESGEKTLGGGSVAVAASRGAKADAVRAGDVFRAPTGEAVTVMRALPGGKVEVRIQGKRLRLGEFKNNELKEWQKIGRADYADGAYTTPQSLIDLAKNESTAPDSGGAFARTKIVGQTNRQHTAAQLQAMTNIGQQIEVPTLKERYQALTQDLGKKLAQGLADQFAPLKELGGSAYVLTRLAKGASGAFETLLNGGKLKLTDGVYDFDQANKGGVLDKLMLPLQGEHHDFLRWVAANRAEKLMAEGRENLFSPADIAALKTLKDGTTDFDYKLQHGPNAGTTTRNRALMYSDALATFNGFQKNVMDMYEQSGGVDPEARKAFESEFYLPFYRVSEEEGGMRGISVGSGIVRQDAIKKLKGGKDKLNFDLLDNTLMNWASLLEAGAKNRAAKASLDTMATLGKAIEAPEATAREMAKSIGKKDSVVWYMDGGKKRFFIVDDPYLLTAVTALDYAGIRGPIMDTMSMFKHALTIGVTASPFFKIRNLIRDSVQVVASGPISYNIGKNLKDGWKKTDPKSDDYFRLLAGGGTIHFSTMYEGSEAKRVQALVEAGVDESTILNSDTKLKTMYRKMEKLLGAYNELGNRGEAVNRAALYDQLIKRGVSHSEASLQARDLMDFSMQGSFTSVRFLTQVVPFMNARIQGLHKLQRAAKEDPQRFAIVLGAASLASLALLGAYGDDDDWKKRTESDRNNFWWFKMGGTAYRIPKPFEIGAIATLAERSAEYIFDKEMTGKRFREQIMQIAGDNLSMNPIPQAVKPILDIYANKDYQGMPIESMGMDRLASEYRFNDRTSMAARGISTAANTVLNPVGINFMSPVQVDHLVRGYFGWLGSTAVATADVLARPATGQPEQASADKFKLMTDGMVSDLRDAPSRYVSQMYDQAREIEQAYGTWRMLQKTGKPQEAAEFLADRREDLAKYKQIEGVKRAEAKFNERIRMIDRSNMPADNKRELIRGIQEQKTRVAMMVN